MDTKIDLSNICSIIKLKANKVITLKQFCEEHNLDMNAIISISSGFIGDKRSNSKAFATLQKLVELGVLDKSILDDIELQKQNIEAEMNDRKLVSARIKVKYKMKLNEYYEFHKNYFLSNNISFVDMMNYLQGKSGKRKSQKSDLIRKKFIDDGLIDNDK